MGLFTYYYFCITVLRVFLYSWNVWTVSEGLGSDILLDMNCCEQYFSVGWWLPGLIDVHCNGIPSCALPLLISISLLVKLSIVLYLCIKRMQKVHNFTLVCVFNSLHLLHIYRGWVKLYSAVQSDILWVRTAHSCLGCVSDVRLEVSKVPVRPDMQ